MSSCGLNYISNIFWSQSMIFCMRGTSRLPQILKGRNYWIQRKKERIQSSSINGSIRIRHVLTPLISHTQSPSRSFSVCLSYSFCIFFCENSINQLSHALSEQHCCWHRLGVTVPSNRVSATLSDSPWTETMTQNPSTQSFI